MLPGRAAVPDHPPGRDERVQVNGHPEHHRARSPTRAGGGGVRPRVLGTPISPLQPQPRPLPPAGHPQGGVSQQSHAVFTLWSLQTFFSSPLSNLGKKVYLNASSRLSRIYLAINKGHIFPTVPRAGFQKGTIV